MTTPPADKPLPGNPVLAFVRRQLAVFSAKRATSEPSSRTSAANDPSTSRSTPVSKPTYRYETLQVHAGQQLSLIHI